MAGYHPIFELKTLETGNVCFKHFINQVYNSGDIIKLSMNIRIKRVYEKAEKTDGQRILVDRLWPRGLTKEKARIDLWVKDIAPSTVLRQWFGHDPAKWAEFRKRYRHELSEQKTLVSEIVEKLNNGTVTFVYGAKDENHNNAVVLKEYLEKNV